MIFIPNCMDIITGTADKCPELLLTWQYVNVQIPFAMKIDMNPIQPFARRLEFKIITYALWNN
jgi:hypothetical protein